MTRHEQAAAGAVRPEALAVGEAVQVCTRMGAPVAAGPVSLPAAAGACVAGRFYEAALYLFQPQLDEARRQRRPKLGALDPEALPEALRKAVTVEGDMTEDQVERVLGAVGDAARKALVDVGVRESAVYARVAAIQTAVRATIEANKGESETAAEGEARAQAAATAKGADEKEGEDDK